MRSRGWSNALRRTWSSGGASSEVKVVEEEDVAEEGVPSATGWGRWTRTRVADWPARCWWAGTRDASFFVGAGV